MWPVIDCNTSPLLYSWASIMEFGFTVLTQPCPPSHTVIHPHGVRFRDKATFQQPPLVSECGTASVKWWCLVINIQYIEDNLVKILNTKFSAYNISFGFHPYDVKHKTIYNLWFWTCLHCMQYMTSQSLVCYNLHVCMYLCIHYTWSRI